MDFVMIRYQLDTLQLTQENNFLECMSVTKALGAFKVSLTCGQSTFNFRLTHVNVKLVY